MALARLYDNYLQLVVRADGPVALSQRRAVLAGAVRVPNLLVVKDSMSDDLAFKLTELVFTKQDELAKVHPEAKNIKRDLATQTDPVQLHPGAKRYFDST